MTAPTLADVAEALARHCRAHAEREGLRTLYAPDAVSVEAAAPPGGEAETRGLAAIEGKHDWWDGAMEMHSATTEGPFLHAPDRFALIFEMDATDRASGVRHAMREVGVYTVGPDGKIVREEFFYTQPG